MTGAFYKVAYKLFLCNEFFVIYMESRFASIRFIVIDTRCFSSELLPCCQDFFSNLKVQLRHFFNLLFVTEQNKEEKSIICLIIVNINVEVIMKPTKIDLEKLYSATEMISFPGISLISRGIDPCLLII